MKLYLYSSHETRPLAPYLLLSNKDDIKPMHPLGKNWTFWKDITLRDTAIGADPDDIKRKLNEHGYAIVTAH